MFTSNKIIQNKKVLFLLGFLALTFYSCDNGVSSVEELSNVEDLRSEVASRFLELENALQNIDSTKMDSQTFKKQAIKHLLKIDETRDRDDFMFISKNYDEAYFKIISENRSKSNDEESAISRRMNKLTKEIEKAISYDATVLVFEDFYSNALTSDELSNSEKNQLFSLVAWYEASLNFFEANHELFLNDLQTQSIIDLQFKGCGWWQRWGKCVAGTIGGYYGGALAGCAVGGGIGSAAAGVGAVPGCAGGAIVGAIGGALSGAAAYCDGCSDK